MLDKGVWAEVNVGAEHLHLFSEHNALGVQASVYNVNAKTWVAPSESVDDIEQGQRKTAYAEARFERTANLGLPSLVLEELPFSVGQHSLVPVTAARSTRAGRERNKDFTSQ